MPEFPMLEPYVLQGVLDNLATSDAFVMTNRIPKETWLENGPAYWDIKYGSRLMGRPNVINSRAHIIPKHGYRQASANLLYYREKAVFEPSELYYGRELGTNNVEPARQKIADALDDLNNRMNNLIEYCIWQALTGHLSLDYFDVQAEVDYYFPASHIATPGTPWDAATPVQIVADIVAWKTLIQQHARVNANEVWTSPQTLRLIVESFTRGSAPDNLLAGGFMTDSMRDEFFRSGGLAGFMGLNWNTTPLYWEDADGNLVPFIPDNRLILGNFDEGRPISLVQGRTGDLRADQNHTGPFTKSFQEEDPSGLSVLLENKFLPIIKRPQQFVVVPTLTS